MNIHEYQAKKILSEYGIKIPKGIIAYTPNEAKSAAEKLSKTGPWMLKAQIQSSARDKGYFIEKDRGEGGGIRLIKSKKKILENAKQMLGATLVTIQTGPQGKKVNRIYVENYIKVEKYFYMSVAINRVKGELTLMVAPLLYADIIKVALSHPERILKIPLSIAQNTKPEQVKEVMDFLKLPPRSAKHLENLVNGIHKVFLQTDASMIEINPVGLLKNGELVALDSKMSIDDNALYRQVKIACLKDESESSEREVNASKYKFTYREFDGSVGCIVNGDGIALAAMDMLKEKSIGTACFINVKGGVDKDKIASGIKIIMTNPRVEGILLNILGGFVRCNLIADGIVAAASEVGLNVPMVIRFEGTNKDIAKEILENSRLPVIWADSMEESVEKLAKAMEEVS
ncbi:MAG: ADP-forming succinate--CoA ligase subunit beta [Alphaproteobacteria bacterium]|nr:ADP-forming succinate--CoA ligase subunit beta [Alphaproteobacteria bacterium]